MGTSDWIALIGVIVAIIGVIVAIIGIIVGQKGKKALVEVDKIKIKLSDIETKIGKLEINSPQIARTIKNKGIGTKEAEKAAKKIVDKKTKNKPDTYYSEEAPEDAKQFSGWISNKEDISDT